MIEIPVADLAGTAGVAAAVAGLLAPGDLVVLSGGLGAGKTAFTQALAAALGVDDPVTSPTFTLVHGHPTRAGWELLHVDLYRLETLDEVADLGLAERLDDGDVAVVEWGERGLAVLGDDYLHVTIEPDQPAGTGRRLRLATAGPAWAARWPRLEAALGARQAP